VSFHSYDDLVDLGTKVRDKAVEVTSTVEYDRVMMAYAPDPRNPRAHDNQKDLPSRSEVADWAAKQYADIPAYFGSFAIPNPDSCHTSAQELWSVAGALEQDIKLGSDPQHLSAPPKRMDGLQYGVTPAGQLAGNIQPYLKDWSGDAAQAFSSNFVNPLNNNIPALGWLAESLAMIMEANGAARVAMLDSVVGVGNKTLNALETIGHVWSSKNVTTAITIMAALASVTMSLGETSGTAASLLKTAIGAKGSVGGAIQAAGGDVRKVDISGGTVAAVIASMRKIVKSVNDDYTEALGSLNRITQGVSSAVQERLSEFHAPSPNAVTSIQHESAQTLDRKGIFWVHD
jgi:hypothetical protein